MWQGVICSSMKVDGDECRVWIPGIKSIIQSEAGMERMVSNGGITTFGSMVPLWRCLHEVMVDEVYLCEMGTVNHMVR